jgi:exodeoxyribonuclease VII small subunit
MVTKKKISEKSFEESLKELETIVGRLEAGEAGLEESLVQFEQGTRLYKECKEQLSVAEKKIAILTDSLKEEEIV